MLAYAANAPRFAERGRSPKALMLIVGGHDDAVLVLNEQAKTRMPGDVSLKIVPRATHLFEEPGALSHAADYAASWFVTTLRQKT